MAGKTNDCASHVGDSAVKAMFIPFDFPMAFAMERVIYICVIHIGDARCPKENSTC
jgi:hypothetical protein